MVAGNRTTTNPAGSGGGKNATGDGWMLRKKPSREGFSQGDGLELEVEMVDKPPDRTSLSSNVYQD